MRERLQCKSFDWYLKNIYPQKFIPGEALRSGEVNFTFNLILIIFNIFIFQIRNREFPYCIDGNENSKAVTGYECHGEGILLIIKKILN